METNFVCVPINPKQFVRLSLFLESTRNRLSATEAIDRAIEYWIENASWKPELGAPLKSEPVKQEGYQWKEVFLPSGTRMRMRYKSRDYYAEVSGNRVIYEGTELSPSQIANKIADGSARNAWRDFYIKRPGDSEWILADNLRAALL